MGNVSVVKEMVNHMKQAIQDLDKLSCEQEVKKTMEVILKSKSNSYQDHGISR